jgi:hypothetical protein
MDYDEPNRANSARIQVRIHKKKTDEFFKEKQSKQKTLVISGHYKKIPFSISKQSKFIYNSNKINQKLNQKVQSTIKKDQSSHGTYSLNPFAFYPKHLKNTLIHLM